MTTTNKMDKTVSLVSALYDVRKEKAALDKVEKNLLAELKPIVDPEFDRRRGEDGETNVPIGIGGFAVQRVSGVSRTISADLLMERGVAPDIVAYATKTVNYFQYRVKEAVAKE